MDWYNNSLYLESAAEIHPYDYENWDEYQESVGMESSDSGLVGADAEKAFKDSNIYLDRAKNISRVVVLDGKTIGAIATSWNVYNNIATFAFDMAIKPEYRGDVGTLFKMIKEGIEMFEQDRGMYEESGNNTEMVLWVVNRKLVPILERFNFSIDEDHGEGGVLNS